MGKGYVMEKSHNTIGRIVIPQRLWTGLCLIGLLLSLALALLPPAARAQVEFDCANVTQSRSRYPVHGYLAQTATCE
ncbi:MAG: hypothetical protein ACK2UW_10555 [Anaerolineales bacterium]